MTGNGETDHLAAGRSGATRHLDDMPVGLRSGQASQDWATTSAAASAARATVSSTMASW